LEAESTLGHIAVAKTRSIEKPVTLTGIGNDIAPRIIAHKERSQRWVPKDQVKYYKFEFKDKT
jgi:hypothetical protein